MDWQSPRQPEESLLLETAPFIFKFQHPSVLQPQLSNVNYFFIPSILVTYNSSLDIYELYKLAC